MTLDEAIEAYVCERIRAERHYHTIFSSKTKEAEIKTNLIRAHGVVQSRTNALRALQARVKRYNDNLNAREIVPNTDDYNSLSSDVRFVLERVIGPES